MRREAFDTELSLQAAGPTTWRLTSPLIWTGTEGDTFTVPIGFITDFATVPRFLHWLVLPYGAYTRAAVLHDWLLTELAAWRQAAPGPEGWEDGSAQRWLSSRPPADSSDTDGIFRRAMEDLGVPWGKRWIMWTAVRWASLFNADRRYGRRIAADLPRMIGMSALALPVMLTGAAGVLVSLGLVRIVNIISSPFRRGRA